MHQYAVYTGISGECRPLANGVPAGPPSRPTGGRARARDRGGALAALRRQSTPSVATQPAALSNSPSADPAQILHEVFGYAAFRGPQAPIVEHVTGGGDALVLMPTGGGKSLTYQLPAVLTPGVTGARAHRLRTFCATGLRLRLRLRRRLACACACACACARTCGLSRCLECAAPLSLSLPRPLQWWSRRCCR